jgi:hypothetical protein
MATTSTAPTPTAKQRIRELLEQRYDEAVLIGLRGNKFDVLVRPNRDGRLDRSRLKTALKGILERL